MKLDVSKISIRWFSFKDCRSEVLAFRKLVYVEEQGLCESLTEQKEDECALHLGAWYDGKLVSSISAYFFDETSLNDIEPEPNRRAGIVLRYGMRMESQEIRGSHLNSLLCTFMCKSVFECLRPVRTYVLLFPAHQHLAKFYQQRWFHKPLFKNDVQEILVCDDENGFKHQYLGARNTLEKLRERYFHNIDFPDLSLFLISQNRTDLIAYEALKQENLYTEGLDVELDLPRLIAQAQQLYVLQKPLLHRLPTFGSVTRWLDMGAGAGAYVNLLKKDKVFDGVHFEGVEGSSHLHLIAKKQYPEIVWHLGSAYQTNLQTESYDIVHCSFLMIHLVNPSLVLREIQRLLKPGGMMYIVDVNDSTFQGPQAMDDVVRKHYQLYEGDRNIMSRLPALAAQHDFSLQSQFNVEVSTDEAGDESTYDHIVSLEKSLFLSMFDFIAQREELAENYHAAKELCRSSNEKMSIHIEAQLYFKSL